MLDGPFVHQSDRGLPYLAIRYAVRLFDAGVESSVGRRGDADVKALGETINGLDKAEVIPHLGSWMGLGWVEYAALERVAWCNTQRLIEPLSHIPPAEDEEQLYRTQAGQAALVLN
jgi:transposase InsO family protein